MNCPLIFDIAKSSAFTHLAATLNGLSTVRSFHAEKLLQNEFDYHQDSHSSCWFIFFSTGCAFGFTLDVFCMLFITCIIYFYMLCDTGVGGDVVGLALTQILSMTGVLQFSNSTDFDNKTNIF